VLPDYNKLQAFKALSRQMPQVSEECFVPPRLRCIQKRLAQEKEPADPDDVFIHTVERRKNSPNSVRKTRDDSAGKCSGEGFVGHVKFSPN
jgi:hypothetical protein